MSRRAIEVDRVSKRYLLGEDRHRGSLQEAAIHWARNLRFSRSSRPREEIWSLRDVSLSLDEGQALGVIGRNGAGKTTLLKILSRITEPTHGVARTRGRVASLLEVGTGFHPELTGRENVYLNGAVLGMSRRDLARRFDEIVDFAGVQRFLDTPIKRYSSGMHLRLAFAVAAHLEPDILVVDEILAVGDAEFQRKCLRRMAAVEQEGRTVVFVSHNLEAIARLCTEAIWLEQGEVSERGPVERVVDAYLNAALQGPKTMTAGWSAGPVALQSVSARDELGKETSVLRRDRPFFIDVHYSIADSVPALDVALYVVNAAGTRIFDEAWSDAVVERPSGPGEYVLRLSVPPVLNVGEYRVGVWIGSRYETLLHEPVTTIFHLEGSVKSRPDRVVELLLPWQLMAVDEPLGAAESEST